MCDVGGMLLTGEAEVLGEEPDPVPLYTPEIPNGLAWDRTHTSPRR